MYMLRIYIYVYMLDLQILIYIYIYIYTYVYHDVGVCSDIHGEFGNEADGDASEVK